MDGHFENPSPTAQLEARLFDISRTSTLELATELLREGRLYAAQELFDRARESDQTSEAAFLGLALSQARLGHLPAAQQYAAQAGTIHRLLNGGGAADAYDAFVAGLAPKPVAAPPKRDDAVRRRSWYSEIANRHPSSDSIAADGAFERYFLSGFVPPAPPIGRGRDIATIGSCFATHIAEYLHKIGRQTSRPKLESESFGNLLVEDEFFNTFVVREAFEIAFGERAPGRNWRTVDPDSYGSHVRGVLYDREHVERRLAKADAYIVTLGLAEIWYDKVDGNVFPCGLNIEEFDDERHGFRVGTVEENLANIGRIYDLIRKHRGPVPIIFTLSPVPLSGTFRPINCIAANTVSKSILRVALDRLCAEREKDPMLFYFPAYEIVTSYFADPFEADLRHVKPDVVAFVMRTFERYFLER